MSEHDSQAALINWARLNENWIPELKTLYANPNAQKFGYASHAKKRNTIVKLKKEGLKPGVPDLTLPIVADHGPGIPGICYIELKYGDNKPTESQEEMMKILANEGNWTFVCWDWIEAAKVLLRHIALHRQQYHPVPELDKIEQTMEGLK